MSELLGELVYDTIADRLGMIVGSDYYGSEGLQMYWVEWYGITTNLKLISYSYRDIKSLRRAFIEARKKDWI